MGKDGFLTPKAISNRIKAKGLLKLKYFCQACQKQCRDANGFKCHCESEGHQRQMAIISQNTGSFINSYSQQFEKEFMDLVRTRWKTKKVKANVVYNEFVSHRLHTHMNATQWTTLSEFVKYLGRTGKVTAEETPKGWYIRYIDRDELERKASIEKKEKMDLDDEERVRRFIEQQKLRASTMLNEMNSSDAPVVNNNSDNSKKEEIKIAEVKVENEEGGEEVKKEKIKIEFTKKPAKFQFNVNSKSNNSNSNNSITNNTANIAKNDTKSSKSYLLEDDDDDGSLSFLSFVKK